MNEEPHPLLKLAALLSVAVLLVVLFWSAGH